MILPPSFLRKVAVIAGMFPGLVPGLSATDGTTQVWRDFVEAQLSGQETRLPDYSYAGYEFGEKEISVPTGARVFDVTDFGAWPDDDLSDRQGIQEAIWAAEKNGGGVVRFPAGRFLVNEKLGARKAIEIRGSNIVLRGNGAHLGGTTLFMQYDMLPADPAKLWTVPPMFLFTARAKDVSSRELLDANGGSKSSVSADAERGDFRVAVEDVSGFSVGDVVTLAAEGTQLNARYLQGLSTRRLWERINTSGVAVSEKHLIVKIEGNLLEFRAPLLIGLSAEEQWSVISYPVLQNCGFEDIHFEGNFLEPFVHHKNTRHDSGFTAVVMEACLNSWIRRCRFTSVSNGASLRGCLASSILLNEMDGNPGHGCFNVSFGTNNLIGLNRDLVGYWHGPNASHVAAGTVVWRFESTAERGGPDFHATFPRSTLWDASSTRSLDSHGGNYKDLPNHLGGLTYWNFRLNGAVDEPVNYWDLLEGDSDRSYGPLTVVNPILVGLHGSVVTFDTDTVGVIESLGKPVAPESLYEAQLALRLGNAPEWIIRAKKEWSDWASRSKTKSP